MKKHCVVSLSGGMDSSTLLLRALSEYDSVTALSFDYGQKHRIELERATDLVKYINSHCTTDTDSKTVDYPYFVNYQVIKLDGLPSLLNSSLVEGGTEVPEGHYEQSNQKETVVPNRNKIFASIAQAVALSIATRDKEPCDIALGVHSGDHLLYPDCRKEFRDADEEAFRLGNWDSELVNYYTPYLEGDKFTILQDGESLCKKLGLEFDEVYKRTNTSYKPYPSGNSDYKSASSIERILAFIQLGRPDPIQYEDEGGEVSWEIAKTHATQIELKFKAQ